jgi:DNA (cytosine-5)-methyltransferase 1
MDDGDAWSIDSDIEKNAYNWTDEPVHRPPSEPSEPTDKPTAIDLFSGPGGLSQGLTWAGFEPVLGVDIHEPSLDTYARNHPHAHTLLGDITRLTKPRPDDRDILDVLDDPNAGTGALLGEVAREALGGRDLTLLTAGIPCQGFSLANRKQHDEDERNYLFEEFVRSVKLLSPEFILIENVSTMRNAKDGAFVEAIAECLNRLGYAVEHRVLKAEEYGVPQSRRRLFFLGSRVTDDIEWPAPTHDEPITVEEAIDDLPPLNPSENADAHTIVPSNSFNERMRDGADIGDALHDHTAPNHQQVTVDRIENTTPGEPMYERFRQRIRLAPDEPAPTIIAGGIRPQFQLGHPTQSRGLSVRERARLQSFPDSYIFEGGMTQSRVQTGMAVPPLLAEALGNSVLTMRDGQEKSEPVQ